MTEREPMTQTSKAAEARQQFSQLLNKVFKRETRVLIQKSGIPVAALISAQDLARFPRLEAVWDEPFKALDAARVAFEDAPDEELEREVAKALTSARAKRRIRHQGTAHAQ